MIRALSMLAALALAGVARAADPMTDAQVAELDRVRGEIANQVHLAAFDLIDELVYGWTKDPAFETPTAVVLAGVTVPVGLGTGLEALIENHLVDVLTQNPTTNLQLVHCPACTAVVVRSGPEGTVISRGIDDPEVLAELGAATGQSALFVDIEAEGAWLVLRARLTRLTPDLPIVWSHTLATSAGAPALLRQPDALKSADDARAEYLAALRDRGLFSIPARLSIRSYARPDGNGIAPPPFVWIQSGVEMSPTDARAWTSSLMVGYSWIPQAYQGIMGQARVNRLITGRSRSLTRPDLYAFVGGSVTSVWGPATAPFSKDVLNADQLLAAVLLEGPRTSFGTLQVGVDLRIGNRIGTSLFLESLPDLQNSPNLGSYIGVLGLRFQSFGTEVTFWF